MSSSNDKDVFSTVHTDVAAVADSTTDDSDNSGGVKGPVVPDMKGNDDVAVAKVEEKKKSGVDDISRKEPVCKVIVGGGEVAGQEKRGDNGDAVVAGAVDSTTFHDDHSGGVGGPVIGPYTKGSVDVADATVDDKNKSSVDDVCGKEPACKVVAVGGDVVEKEKIVGADDVVVAAAVESTPVDEDHSSGGGGAVVGAETKGKDDVAVAMVDNKDKRSVDHVSEQEADSIASDRMQNRTRRSLLSREYEMVWGVHHRSQSSASENPDTASDVTVNVDKAEVGSYDKDETESDEVGED
jgi:hypothetical protein